MQHIFFTTSQFLALHPSDIPQVNIMPPTPQASNLTAQALKQTTDSTPGPAPGYSGGQLREQTVMEGVTEEESDDEGMTVYRLL